MNVVIYTFKIARGFRLMDTGPIPSRSDLQSTNPSQPMFWGLLNDQDRDALENMRRSLGSPACRHRRHNSVKINAEIMNMIKSFIVRHDSQDPTRALVCGICWLPDGIAINTRQLRLLLGKCKSSINALFQSLGYATTPVASDFVALLSRMFPLLKDNPTELRKWTVRVPRQIVLSSDIGQHAAGELDELPPLQTTALPDAVALSPITQETTETTK